ncbi:EboA domain-containing protein [Flagellimonas sp. 2504JD4-2]
MKEIKSHIKELLWPKLLSKEKEWVQEKTALPSVQYSQKFPILFSQASRYIENLPTLWERSELLEMQQLYPGFDENAWTKRDLVRVYLMLSLIQDDNGQVIKSFFTMAEMNELVALYKGLFFLDNAKEFTAQVKEGIRTNMVNVFDAICLGNPYAAEYLDEAAWNQLILKAVFMERPLFKIHNIDKRKNKALAEMLQDYVKERWAASRDVTPEIWRMMDTYLNEDVKALILKRELKELEKQAIAVVMHQDTVDNGFWDSVGKMNITKT